MAPSVSRPKTGERLKYLRFEGINRKSSSRMGRETNGFNPIPKDDDAFLSGA